MFEWFSLIFTPLADLSVAGSIRSLRNPIPSRSLNDEELRSDFELHLPAKNKYGYYCDAIVRDIKRIDSFPDQATEWKEMSPYFKVAIKDLYHRGIEVFTGIPQGIKKDMYGDWHFVNYSDEDTILVYCVGKIPFDSIDHVDWGRDEPHIYCRFKGGDPFEARPFYTKFDADSEEVYEVKGFRPWDKKKGFWFLKFWGLRGE
jgi:hypothetical protein